MQAYCQNEDCGHNWEPQKHPSEYSRGITCPDCGTTRVEVEGVEQQPQQPQQSQQRDRRPAPRRTSAEQQMDTRQQGGGDFGAVEGAIAVMDDDTPAQAKAQGAQALLGGIGNALGKVFQYQEQKEQAADEKIKQSDLQPVEDYPQCKCGYTFTGEDAKLGSDMVKCPECGQAYEVSLPEPPQ